MQITIPNKNSEKCTYRKKICVRTIKLAGKPVYLRESQTSTGYTNECLKGLLIEVHKTRSSKVCQFPQYKACQFYCMIYSKWDGKRSTWFMTDEAGGFRCRNCCGGNAYRVSKKMPLCQTLELIHRNQNTVYKLLSSSKNLSRYFFFCKFRAKILKHVISVVIQRSKTKILTCPNFV